MDDDMKVIGPQELADLLSVPIATIYQWRYRGSGPEGFRVGRHLRFRMSDVVAWIDEQRRATGRS